MIAWIPGIATVAAVVWLVATYNRLVRLRNLLANAWHQIDVQLKRRHDLIPNLVEVVKDYMSYEQDTLRQVIEARGAALRATGTAGRAKAENALTESLKSLFAVVESYPGLRADRTVASLQEELTSTENRISFARQYYNDSVMRYNTTIQSVPSNVVAGVFDFAPADYFEGGEEAQAVPRVDLR